MPKPQKESMWALAARYRHTANELRRIHQRIDAATEETLQEHRSAGIGPLTPDGPVVTFCTCGKGVDNLQRHQAEQVQKRLQNP